MQSGLGRDEESVFFFWWFSSVDYGVGVVLMEPGLRVVALGSWHSSSCLLNISGNVSLIVSTVVPTELKYMTPSVSCS